MRPWCSAHAATLGPRIARAIEVIVIGTMTVTALSLSVNAIGYRFLEDAAHEEPRIGAAFIERYTANFTIVWMTTILLYGIFIPNTARRSCALVTGTIALSPLILFAIYACGIHPLDPNIVAEVLLVLGFWNTRP